MIWQTSDYDLTQYTTPDNKQTPQTSKKSMHNGYKSVTFQTEKCLTVFFCIKTVSYNKICYLECMCTGLLWCNIQKLGTGTFAFQIIYHLSSFLDTHFGVDGTCNNLLLMEMINLILMCTKQIINISVKKQHASHKLKPCTPQKYNTKQDYSLCMIQRFLALSTCNVAISNLGRTRQYCCQIFTGTTNVELHKCRQENFSSGTVLANEICVWQ